MIKVLAFLLKHLKNEKLKNSKLAIAIPTFNRSEILRENLLLMLDDIKDFSIPIYISDDSKDDFTFLIIKELRKLYSFIYYFKNSPSLGHDKNCFKTLGLAEEEYIWYLNDSSIIKSGGIKKILDIINSKDFDFIVVNEESRQLNIANKEFNDGNELLINLGWHLTMTGVTIYSKKNFNIIKDLNPNYCKNFPQTALIFEKFTNGNCKLLWLNDKLIYGNKNKKSYWERTVFEVFLYDWCFFITNLSNYYLDANKKSTIIMHSKNSGLFTLNKFLIYRSENIFNYQILKKYFIHLKDNSNVNVLLLFVISILPKKALKYIREKYF